MLFLEPIRLGFQTGPATKALNLAPMTRTTITTRETVPKKTKEAGGSTSMGFAHSSKDLQRWKSIYQSSIIIKKKQKDICFFTLLRCHSAHLNGRYYPSGYYNSVTDDGVVWYTWRGWWYSLKTSIMKLRPTAFEIDPIDDPNVVHRSPDSQAEEDLKSIVGRN